MKQASPKLLFHSLHTRPMPGCLPLFFLMAALVVAGLVCLVKVSLPMPLRPRGNGNMYYSNDELTRFQVRQSGALPLRLPAYADPAARLPVPEHPLPLRREVGPAPAPPLSITNQAPDSAVLSADALLTLPPPADSTPQEGGQP